jgi:acyl carrier protein
MERGEAYEKLTEIFRNVFDNENITISDETPVGDIEDWDSFEHINLIAAIEREFGIRFTMGEIQSLENVGGMVDVILRQLSQKD